MLKTNFYKLKYILGIFFVLSAFVFVWRYNQRLNYLSLNPFETWNPFRFYGVDENKVNVYQVLNKYKSAGYFLYIENKRILPETIELAVQPIRARKSNTKLEIYEYSSQDLAEDEFRLLNEAIENGTINGLKIEKTGNIITVLENE